jgi:N-acetyl-gamma-glutamylphosphate reductase
LLATVYGRLRDPGLTAEDLTTVYQVTYRDHPCVEILPVAPIPPLSGCARPTEPCCRWRWINAPAR